MSVYAIIELGGRQHRVEPGHWLETNRLAAKVGASHPVDQVLLAADGAQLHVGRPYVAGAQVVCEVLEHRLGPKVISYKFRRRENFRKTVGHRQALTRLLVKQIIVGGKTTAAAAKVQAAPKAKPTAEPTTKPIAAASKTAGKSKAALPAPRKPAQAPARQAGKKPHDKER